MRIPGTHAQDRPHRFGNSNQGWRFSGAWEICPMRPRRAPAYTYAEHELSAPPIRRNFEYERRPAIDRRPTTAGKTLETVPLRKRLVMRIDFAWNEIVISDFIKTVVSFP